MTIEKRLIKRFNPNLNWEYSWINQYKQIGLNSDSQNNTDMAKTRGHNRPPPRLRNINTSANTHPKGEGPSGHYFAKNTTYQMLDFEGPNLNNIVGHIRANEIPQARIKFQRCTATDTTNWKQLLRTSGTWDTWFLGKIAPLKIHFKEIEKSKISTIIFLEYSKPITKTNARKILVSRAIQHTLKECEETLHLDYGVHLTFSRWKKEKS